MRFASQQFRSSQAPHDAAFFEVSVGPELSHLGVVCPHHWAALCVSPVGVRASRNGAFSMALLNQRQEKSMKLLPALLAGIALVSAPVFAQSTPPSDQPSDQPTMPSQPTQPTPPSQPSDQPAMPSAPSQPTSPTDQPNGPEESGTTSDQQTQDMGATSGGMHHMRHHASGSHRTRHHARRHHHARHHSKRHHTMHKAHSTSTPTTPGTPQV